MSRWFTAACLAAVISAGARAAEPKPLWEITATSGEKTATIAWATYSPDGKAIVTVVVREGAPNPQEFAYQLKVYDAKTQKERFTAELGTSKTQFLGDQLATFPTDDSVLTGGRELSIRNLENGNPVSGNLNLNRVTGGLADHAVWAVPDLRETFFLRRDPSRFNLPVELLHSTNLSRSYDEFSGRGGYRGQQVTRQVAIRPPRDTMRTETVVLNPCRTRAAVAFRDESTTTTPRHTLVLYRLKTLEDLELEAVCEASDPQSAAVSAAVFARNGRTLATGAEDGSVSLWDVSDQTTAWQPRARITGVAGHRVIALAFSPDWRYLAAATWDKTKPNLMLIDVDAGKLLRAVKMERELSSLAWSTDGRTLITAGASGKLRAWDVPALLTGE